nr:MAG TPA: hypothetical protein [Caudoviricetes sp.]
MVIVTSIVLSGMTRSMKPDVAALLHAGIRADGERHQRLFFAHIQSA